MGIPSKAGRTSLDGARASPLPPAAAGGVEFLDALPDSIVQLHLLPQLEPSDKCALR
jgi:hypothetical protein